ncbi:MULTISPECIES: hypothetical protein [Thalassospira]|uniref:Uncharacterized protein n=1 Tax=Thalassospira profundimaris TaxID=502049 RepID=A0A367VMU6_9PROT|nr:MULTISPECIES: hypothetical protein [Thalassospira]KZB70796.1 hypothetical protein AUQ43_07990 [Thalassospira sp. MCCC 1A01148]RCK25570.1 hypothetical protein TH6_02885 [Thalassospira profundimaris]
MDAQQALIRAVLILFVGISAILFAPQMAVAANDSFPAHSAEISDLGIDHQHDLTSCCPQVSCHSTSAILTEFSLPVSEFSSVQNGREEASLRSVTQSWIFQPPIF